MQNIKITEIKAKSLVRKMKRIDSWFLAAYGMNIYRGCQHDCLYCDGRAEKYQTSEDFGHDITVKINAVELLERELDPRRKRKPFKKGYFCIGGGVGDSYQPIEEKYQLTRQILESLSRKNFPLHILTKSNLVLRDIDLLKKINKQNRVIVSFSFSTVSDELSQQFEPNASSPSQRLQAANLLKKEGISVGILLMPLIPFITDTPEQMTNTLKKIKQINPHFILYGGMTLKQGRQMEFFYQKLSQLFPDLIPSYQNIYFANHWGSPIDEYHQSLQQIFTQTHQWLRIPQRIPPSFYTDILDENDKVMVMLEHIDFFLKAQGKKSPLGYAAYSLSQLKEPISNMKFKLRSLKGVGAFTEKIILEILNTGKSSMLEKFLP